MPRPTSCARVAAHSLLGALWRVALHSLPAAVLAISLLPLARAEVLDATFNPAPSVYTWATVTQPDGRILVGGAFLGIAGSNRSYFARLNANGSLDSTFNPDVNRIVYTVALQPDGKILIGGSFSSVGGRARACLARLNADGSLDTAFDAGLVGTYIRAILPLPDGRILIGGDLTSIGGQPRTALARLNSNGTLDPTFIGDATGTLSATAGRGVFAIARQTDGNVLIVGQFTMVNGIARWGLARLNADGVLELGFNPSSTNPTSVAAVLVQRDGRIVVGGGFAFMGGVPRRSLARLNADGSVDFAFNPDPDSVVQAIVEQPDGKLLVGGLFARIGGVSRSLVARLNADGTLDPSFTNVAAGTLSATNAAVYGIERSANGRILLAGTFSTVDGTTRNALARLVQPAPDVIAPPASTTVAAGETVTLSATIAGAAPLQYQWRKDGVPLSGATGSTLTFRPAQLASAGRYDVMATNGFGSVLTTAAVLTINPAAPRLVNVSVRTPLAAAQSLIVGLTVSGSATPILVRAAGPALTRFGLASAMVDPRLELYRDSTKLLENDNWPDVLAPTFTSVGAFPFDVGSRDAALLQTLSGPHSTVATGSGAGVVLVEAYDASAAPTGGRLVNISARNRVQADEGILIAGFSVSGGGTITLLIRAVGPTLGLPPFGLSGVLADPVLEIYDARGVKIAENDTWNGALSPTFSSAGAFALAPASKDAALLVTLPAGASYTAQVSGQGGSVGEALVEIYEVP